MSKSFEVIAELHATGENEFEGEIDLKDARKMSKDRLRVGLFLSRSLPRLIQAEMENGENQSEYILVGFSEKTTPTRKRTRQSGKSESHDET